MEIKILGTGCPNCIKLEDNVRLALEKTWIEATIIKVTDIEEISTYGIMGTPGLIFDGKVVSSGKVLSVDEVIELLQWERGEAKRWCCAEEENTHVDDVQKLADSQTEQSEKPSCCKSGGCCSDKDNAEKPSGCFLLRFFRKHCVIRKLYKKYFKK